MPDDLKIELVASEPMVQDPVVITFDEAGRLWVVEMRGFMPDIDGNGEKQPVGRISILEDLDHDGTMDTSRIYIDSLIMPRALAVVRGGALIVENESLWLTEDNDGDLRADTKTLIDSTYAGSALPEHSGNGLLRGLDNWYYNVKSRLRYKLANGNWIRDSTEFRGQWGLSHDDIGRLYYNYNWSQLHADLVPPNYLSANKHHTPATGIDHGLTRDRRVYPIRSNPAVNRGYIPGTLDKEGKLLEFTAACSPFYYRAPALGEKYYGNVFVCEPSGNLVKRNVVVSSGAHLAAYDPSPGTEFLASTDERFRPVFLASGPDGALYIADMYRGLVQHGAHVTPYLREQTLKRKLVQPINRGRIWRIVSKSNGQPKRATSNLAIAPNDTLVKYLSHSNGWHRDMSQRLLVERNDRSIKIKLTNLALKGRSHVGRIHALWTLEGLDLASADILLKALNDGHVSARVMALRILEPMARNSREIRTQLHQHMAARVVHATMEEVLQITLSARSLDAKPSLDLLRKVTLQYDTSALMRDAILSSIENKEFEFTKALINSPEWNSPSAAKEIFLESLVTAIVKKRDAGEIKSLLALLEHNNPGWKEKSILTAMSVYASGGKIMPVKLSSPPPIFSNPNSRLDTARLATLSTLFEWPGHIAVNRQLLRKNPLSEKEQQQFAQGRQHYLNSCAGCHGSDGVGINRFAPTLVGSEWVLGDAKRLSLIVLHGMEGPVEVAGKRYDAPEILPVMPAHSTLDDATISSILTYIRNEWGNDAGAISPRAVGTVRHTSQGRVIPWTAAEVNKYVENTKETKPGDNRK